MCLLVSRASVAVFDRNLTGAPVRAVRRTTVGGALVALSGLLISPSAQAWSANRVASTFRAVGLPVVTIGEGRDTELLRPHAARDPLSLAVTIYSRRRDARDQAAAERKAQRPSRFVRPELRVIEIGNVVVVFDPTALGAKKVVLAVDRLRN